jgi:hypothetical protein
MAKDCRSVAFRVMFDMTPYAVQTENRYPYQLVAVISHLGNPEKEQSQDVTFLRIFDQWIRFNNTEVEAIEELAVFNENFPETEGSIKPPLSCSMWQTTEQIIQ